MIDIVNQINATHREIGNQPVATGPGRSVLLRRGTSDDDIAAAVAFAVRHFAPEAG
jgi:hypothetical protein